MELLEGETLSERLRAGPFAPAEALPLAEQMVDALEAAHARFPIHYSASDREPIERFRRAIAERLPPEALERLRREGAALTLEEAMLRVVAFHPSTS
jgi:hypothetical protein